MAQHDYDIANSDGATVRADLNAIFEAIASLNAGASAPSPTFAHMYWADTSAQVLKQRNPVNTGWVTISDFTGIPTRLGTPIGTAALLANGGAIGDVVVWGTDGGSPAGLKYPAGDGSALTGIDVLNKGTPLVQNPYTLSATPTQTHGLGAEPDFLAVELECLTAELGYSIGDVVPLSVYGPIAAGAAAWTCYKTASLVGLVTGGTAGTILHKSTGVNNTVTPGNWKLTITPYLRG